ncbi:hypothetical protein SEA_HANS_3 [Gordonia phage Hans]|nr:hypothetical protein SEA_HANS_3 [Gordonia phage Hans]
MATKRNTFPDEQCAVCAKTFDAALEDGTSGEWTFQWGSPTSATVAAETCSDACSDMFESMYRTPARTVR